MKMQKLEQKEEGKRIDCKGKACTKRTQNFKRNRTSDFSRNPDKISEMCRCYLDILIPIVSYLGMKHSIQDLKQELKPASPPSTPSDGNPFRYYKITPKLSQLLCTLAFSHRTQFCHVPWSMSREEDADNGYTNNFQAKPDKRATVPLP